VPELHWWQWALGALAAYSVGIAKAGIPGLGMVAVPLMVLAVGNARASIAWLLPLLILADFLALLYWRRHADVRVLLHLAPWVLVGYAAGGAALALDETYMRHLIAVIILLMFSVYLFRRFRPNALLGSLPPAPYGFCGGFATTVANAAGPVMNIYLLSMNLPKEQFMGNTVWFFAIINLLKVPIYASYGLFDAQSLTFDVTMIPAVVAGAITGRWLFEHIPQAVFEGFVIVTTLVSTLLLFR